MEVLNAVCEERKESLLSFTLKEALVVDAINETTATVIIGD